jgi:catechol 2,3-dioxygenase-like lactoylglutathione lyase family enzyme
MTSLDHIGLYVTDLKRTIEFYKQLFNFPLKDSFELGEAKIGLMEIGGGLLEFIQRPGSPGSPPEGNWTHLAFYVPDFDGKISILDGMNIERRLVTMEDGERLCFFKDPDGHTVELMEKGFN